ncbi:MAG: type IV toxin-antitoxin system AbiEi family antitoxin [Deltaproteobacteria bacterium]|nr:type IV toxin-antitoxin system AbiEi family antitoxin [Deltaproteobacteria bacterium]
MSELVDRLQASGRYVLTAREAQRDTGLRRDALQKAARRLVLADRLCSPREGFFVIVPLEYQSAGSPPPAWFVHDLMAFVGQPYYVGLLSAAAIHGAAHQQPQEFQIVTSAPLPMMLAGRARLRFVVKRGVKATPTESRKTDTGAMAVSTPEATALDLVRYPKASGGLGNVATVLSELVERLDGPRLAKVARSEGERATAQRLGYLLDRIGGGGVSGELARWIGKSRARVVPLRPTRVIRGLPKDEKWRVLVNAEVEPDEGTG